MTRPAPPAIALELRQATMSLEAGLDDGREACWRDDLDVLAAELPALHRNAFHTIAEATWHDAVAELDARIGELDDPHIVVELARLVAMIGDAHTRLARCVPAHYPLELYDFADGLHVIAAPDPRAIGARLLGVGGTSIEHAVRALAPLVSRDNAAGLRAAIPRLLADPTILAGTDLASDRASFTIAGGELALEPVPGPPPVASPPGPALWQQRTALPAWTTYDAERRLVYLQYNRGDEPFAAIAAAVLAAIDERPVDRIAIDLRHSDGAGDERVIRPLLRGLVVRPHVAGRLFAIVGRGTFGAGLVAAIELHQQGAILVGEPTGGKPCSYGEAASFTLPCSGIAVEYATRYLEHAGLDGDALVPQRATALTSADWLAGRDPALDAVLA